MAYSTAFQATGTLGRISPKLASTANPLLSCCTAAMSVIDCFIKYKRYSNEVKRTELLEERLEVEIKSIKTSNREHAKRIEIFKRQAEIEKEALAASNYEFSEQTNIIVSEIEQKATIELQQLKNELSHQISTIKGNKEIAQQNLLKIKEKNKQCLDVLSKIKSILNNIHESESNRQWQPDLEEDYRIFLKKFAQIANELS